MAAQCLAAGSLAAQRQVSLAVLTSLLACICPSAHCSPRVQSDASSRILPPFSTYPCRVTTSLYHPDPELVTAMGQCHADTHFARALQVVSPASSSAFAQGRTLSVPRPAAARCSAQRLVTFAAAAQAERLRLNNLSPQDGSRRKAKRKGRGYGAGQVSTELRWRSN